MRLLLAFLCLVGSFTLMNAQPTHFAVVGDGTALGSWSTPQLFTKNSDGTTYTLVLTDVAANAKFKLSGRSDTEFTLWGNFNAGVFHNSSLSSGDNTLNFEGQDKGDMTLPVSGNVTLTISDVTASSLKLKISCVVTTDVYSVVGQPTDVFGGTATWAKDNDMTESDGVWTWTSGQFTNVSDIQFKVRKNHDWGSSWGASSGGNYQLTADASKTYTLTVTFNGSSITSATLNEVISYPDIYLHHWKNNISSSTDDVAEKMTGSNGSYSITLNLDKDEYLLFTDYSAHSWTTNRYNPSAQDVLSGLTTANATANGTAGENTSVVFKTYAEGNYTFTFNYSTKAWTAKLNSVSTSYDWYLVGVFSNWTTNKVGMTANGDGTYSVTQTFSGEFKIYDGANWWGGGSSVVTITATSNNPYTCTKGQSNLKLEEENEYTLTWNPTTHVLTVTGFNNDRETGEMYLVGDVNGNAWTANMGTKMTKISDGVYQLDDAQLMSGATFAFTGKLGSSTSDWTTFNSYRYFAVSDNCCEVFDNMVGNVQTSTDGTAFSLQTTGDTSSDKNNFKMKTSGSYRITVNTNTMKVTFQKMYKSLYMIGKGFTWSSTTISDWAANKGIEMTTTDGNIYHLDAVTMTAVSGQAQGFLFTEALATANDADAWTYIADYLYSSPDGQYDVRKDETRVDINTPLALSNKGAGSADNKFYLWPEAAGKYNVIVNLSEKTVTLKENITVEEKLVIRLEQTGNVTKPGVDVSIENGSLHKLKGTWADGANGSHMNNQGGGNVTSQGQTYYLGGNTWFNCREYTSFDNRKWWEWEIGGTEFRIASIKFYRNGNENDNPSDPNGALSRRAGILYYTWVDSEIEDYTTDYYVDHVKEVPGCATMLDDHYYVYFVNTPGWSTVYCYAWDSNDKPSGTAAWPGSQCVVVGYNEDGFAVYRYDFGLKSEWEGKVAGVIFNCGPSEQGGSVAEQTGDFDFKNGATYDYVGRVSLGRSLGNIIANGVVNGPLYEVEDDLTIVYYDPYETGTYTVPIYEDGVKVGTTTTSYTGAFYAKDNNTANRKSLNTSGKRDYVFMTHFKGEKDNVNYELLMPGRTRYDQSNWVKLVCANDYASNSTNANWNAATLVGKKIAGDNLGGQLVDNLNPTMIVETLPANALSAASYTKNDYIMTHFNDNYTVNGEGDFFFVQPKPQEVAHITWAVYNAANDAFYVPAKGVELNHDAYDEEFYGMFLSGNNFDLKGGIKVASWDLAGQDETAIRGRLRDKQAYQFNAIIRYKDNTATPAPHSRLKAPAESNYDTTFNPANSIYEVYPVEINVNDWIVTGINDISDSSIKEVKSVKVYDTMGVERREMQGGVNIVVTTYSDGTRSVQKILK
ncbi:MAG: starch-binding protein [Muribaculaceae bacterium]|nr:starch-binding protein [Muribaculaceae bacterium]